MVSTIITVLLILIVVIAFFGLVTVRPKIEFNKEQQPLKKPRKKRDTTKLNQYHYDFIIQARADWEEFNKNYPNAKLTVKELTDVINNRMGTDKSTRALGRIWSGEISRDSLPRGKKTFEFEEIE